MDTGTQPRRQPTGSRRRSERLGDDGRQLSTAGHALVVAALALALGALLSAPGLHKSAFNQQPGVKRDIALALTGPLADVSHALLLDRPRRAVKEVIGRGDDDVIDTEIELPPTAAVAPAARPRPSPGPAAGNPTARPRKVAFTPKKRLRLWVAGDSLVITPGLATIRAAAASPVLEPVGTVDGRVATGLGRPDVFNWFREITDKVRALKPGAVVVSFGANDNHDYMTGLPQGVSIGGFGSASWTREYRRRVAGVMDGVSRGGAYLVWIGLPVARSAAQTQRFDVINAIVSAEARKRPGRVAFVDTYTMFASDTGDFTEYLQSASGRAVKVRAGDGVHFEPAGGAIIAREVLKRLNAAYDLTSWRKRTASGSRGSGTNG
jgi:hypothetical protein